MEGPCWGLWGCRDLMGKAKLEQRRAAPGSFEQLFARSVDQLEERASNWLGRSPRLMR